jgi:hypothetical protein
MEILFIIIVICVFVGVISYLIKNDKHPVSNDSIIIRKAFTDLNNEIKEILINVPIATSISYGIQNDIQIQKAIPCHNQIGFFTKIRGVTHKNNDDSRRQELIARLIEGEIIYPEYYPDSCSICFFNEDRKLLGFSSDELKEELSDVLKAGATLKAVVSNITGGYDGKQFGCNIHLECELNGVQQIPPRKIKVIECPSSIVPNVVTKSPLSPRPVRNAARRWGR